MRAVPTELHIEQQRRWPRAGRHILAAFDETTVCVYQAYRPSIAAAAVHDQRFGGGGFRLTRMSWVKPNFLWMMYRAGWATKPGQERILRVRLTRAFFDGVLARAVHSSHVAEVYGDRAAWRAAVQTSDVRLQWDPDHAPDGSKTVRRAIQLGLRGPVLQAYATECVEIEDITRFVSRERAHRGTDALLLPRERVYPVADPAVRARLGLDAAGPDRELDG